MTEPNDAPGGGPGLAPPGPGVPDFTRVEGEPRGPGEHLVNELLWVHRMIREDLETVRELARQTLEGMSPEQIRAEVEKLETGGPLFKLRVNCLYYCRFVHAHHSNEDVNIFPALRRSDPSMEPVVDRLESDHLMVAGFIGRIDANTEALVERDTPELRAALTADLDGLAEHLLAHLDYEEEKVTPTLLTWTAWPA